MKKILVFISVLLAFASCDSREGAIKVCVVTDVHGCYFDSTLTGGAQTKGSLSRVSQYLKELRQQVKGVVVIDNGDNLQGELSAYYYNYVDTQTPHIYGLIEKYLDYDAIIVGNHDIEAGHGTYDRVREQYEAPLLAANAVKPDGTCYFERYTVVEAAGRRIAVIGFTNPNMRGWFSEDIFRGMDFLNPQDMAQSLVDEVRLKEKPDYVIVSIHSGSGDGTPQSFEHQALNLALTLSGVDVVIAGHDHKPCAEKLENGVLFVNPGSRCSHVGEITFPLKGGEPKVQLVDMAEQPSDPEYNEFLKDEFAKVRAFAGQHVCNLKGEIDLSDVLDGPNPYVSLIHNAQLAAMGVQISFAAPLGRKAVIEAGDLCYEDILKIYPYENELYAVELTGRQIKDYLEMSYDTWVNGTGKIYNYDSAAGINYKVYPTKPKGKRVVITGLSKGGQFSLKKSYTVAMTSFRTFGGGNLLKDGAGIDPAENQDYIIARGGFIRDYIFDYLKSQGNYTPETLHNWSFVK